MKKMKICIRNIFDTIVVIEIENAFVNPPQSDLLMLGVNIGGILTKHANSKPLPTDIIVIANECIKLLTAPPAPKELDFEILTQIGTFLYAIGRIFSPESIFFDREDGSMVMDLSSLDLSHNTETCSK
ncbi:hypothetical protein [Moritella sp. F3]|uniref:hypothetical protein n=1 Tax=Moritella sp. F3 TaxID=2718882 RepID=UPI0018E1CAEA|nr:hypothetical protein [Moritella sp. F3]GIC77117.1 hypothetical protein FMO001_18440 [Moritella sp. F1]GIC82236.1 hypothetical protein FMO003_25170 [Moritella sp. F3]